ncbi:MAG: dihydroorotase [Alphaproteobacteria bacterium]|uniref:Dihydroorotase n=1 Tax=Candidatus Nitrobium versatile TaxID=2884831 RepID=A0A953M2S7_9BACT|nr:dihydroorotase [Candidatus Nitrobium versatile]
MIIKDGRLLDPSRGIDSRGDIIIEGGKITGLLLKNGAPEKKRAERGRGISYEGVQIDAKGLLVFPGLVDMHTHLREPGFEHKETIRTGTLAAVQGGFTSVCPMPNTNPVNDNPTVTAFIIKRALEEGACSVYPIGAITKGQKGEELAEMGLMYEAGCVAFSDDGRPVMSSIIMRRALEYSKAFGVPVISHCEDLTLTDDGVMNEGVLSVTMGLKGIPAAAEEIMVARDILLAEMTGGRLHIAHVSTEGSVRLIRQAKERGVQVTAETCPHYFSVTEEAVRGYSTNAKVNPPLRTQKDVAAIKEGLRDGTLDVIATDHAPHHRDEKDREFDKAPSGISGLETAWALSLRLVQEGVLSLHRLVEVMALNPARILGIGKGTLAEGSDADIVLVDGENERRVEAESFLSKGKNTPFDGWLLRGNPVRTIVRGKVYDIR